MKKAKADASFSALQRAEIAEISRFRIEVDFASSVSVLFNEPKLLKSPLTCGDRQCDTSFSALQRAEIAEIFVQRDGRLRDEQVSVLFNEPKLLKSNGNELTRARLPQFQCSSTSRNC